MDLVRAILLALEQERDGPLTKLDGYSKELFGYHVGIMIDARLIEGKLLRTKSDPFAAAALRMTWKGHDFLDNARSDTVWSKVKTKLLSVGGTVSIDILISLLNSIVRSELGLDS